MDEQIVKSAFIDINLIELRYSEDKKSYRFVYEVVPRKKINKQYAERHLALRVRDCYSKN